MPKENIIEEIKKYIVVDGNNRIPDGGVYYSTRKSAQEHINEMGEFKEIAYKNPKIITIEIKYELK